jgi:hypothetical protein
MTLPTSTISLSDIQTEFGGSNPISLSEYYASGTGIPSGVASGIANIPSSGVISFNNFHGAIRTFNVTISSNTPDYNLMTALQNAGANITGTFVVKVTINAIVYAMNGSVGFNTGPLAGGAVYITNNSWIVGKGGAGGAGAYGGAGQRGLNGGAGTTAFWAQTTTYFTNNGYIGGGGGGGGGGAGGDYGDFNAGSPGNEAYGGGGGGGAGHGVAGPVRPPSNPQFYAGQTAGGTGTYNSPGGGGQGGSYQGYGNDRWGWFGGAGGGLGSVGANGGGLGQPGGAAGAAVAGNGNITWIATGTRYGALT